MTVYCSHFGGLHTYVTADRTSELKEFMYKLGLGINDRTSKGRQVYNKRSLPQLTIDRGDHNRVVVSGAKPLPWGQYMKKRFELMGSSP